MRTFIKRICTLPFLFPTGMTIISIVYLIDCLKLNFGTTSSPEEGFIPFIVGFLFFGGSCLLAVEAFIKIRKIVAFPVKVEKTEIFSILMLTGVLIGFLLLLPILGFSCCTFSLTVASAKIMRAKWISAFMSAISVTLISYIIFIFWLQIPFP